jgi:hypothetical protein
MCEIKDILYLISSKEYEKLICKTRILRANRKVPYIEETKYECLRSDACCTGRVVDII